MCIFIWYLNQKNLRSVGFLWILTDLHGKGIIVVLKDTLENGTCLVFHSHWPGSDDGLLGFCDSLIVIFCLYYFSPMTYSPWLCEWCFTIHWLLLGEVPQLCPTLCNPMDCSLPGSSIHGIFQARVLEWVAISFSRESSWPRDRNQISCIVGRRFTIWARKGHNTLLLGLNKNLYKAHCSSVSFACGQILYCLSHQGSPA